MRNDLELTRDDNEFIKFLDKALDKMPEYEGTVKRVITANNQEQYESIILNYYNRLGKSIRHNQYLSSSLLEDYSEKAQIWLIIKSKTGKNIIKYNTEEQEILFKRNVKFVVKSVEVGKNSKLVIIKLIEV